MKKKNISCFSGRLVKWYNGTFIRCIRKFDSCIDYHSIPVCTQIDKVSEGVQQARYDICQGCEKLYKPTDTCKMCGCFMKVKTWLPAQECPLQKWGKSPAADNIKVIEIKPKDF